MRVTEHRTGSRSLRIAPALPLASHIWYRADDGEDAYRWLARTMMPRTLFLEARGRSAGVVNRASLGDIHFNVVKMGRRFSVDFDAIADSYVVYLPLSGHLDATVNGERYSFRRNVGLIASPDDPVHLDFSENAVGILIQIPRKRMERHLRSMGGDRPDTLRFLPELDLAKAGGLACARMVDFLIEGLENGSWQSAAVVGEMERAFMSSLLVAQQNSHSERLSAAAPSASARPYYVQRAERFMGDHLEQPLTLADLVKAAGVSERTLQAGFQRCYATTPLRRLKGMRLDHIHRALLGAAPGSVRVTEVAATYGFYQFGRFAAEYKDMYGALPSETLRRTD